MSTFYRYLDEVPISGYVGNGTWNAFDLAPYLVGTDIQAVTLRIYKAGAGSVTVGFRSVGSDEEYLTVVSNEGWCTDIVSLNGGTEIDIYSTASTPVISVSGELRRNCACHPAAVYLETTLAQGDTWVSRTPSLLTGDKITDVRAVVLKAATLVGTDALMGARRMGSSDPPVTVRGNSGRFFTIVSLDETGAYETYVNDDGFSVLGLHFEVAYLKNDSNVYSVMDHIDLDLTGTANAWTVVDLSGSIPDETVNVGIRIVNDGATRVGFVRTIGSQETSGRNILGGSMGVHYAMANENLEIEYSSFDFSMNFYVDWYELPAKTAVMGKVFVGPATQAEGFTGPATLAGTGLFAGTEAEAGFGPAATGTATFDNACRATASIGVG